jgi:hypothetical protein
MKAYAHMLCHVCGYHLANKRCDLHPIQDYLAQRGRDLAAERWQLPPGATRAEYPK